MRKKTNNKNMVISILIIMLLALGVGYAAFSDTLTITGTANAKGTFDLEFQNAEIVKNVGADTEKTTAVIGADGDTLTVNAADLAYPGSGVEFAVDIVNMGSMPAEIQSVNPTNITGSDKIKVTGLEEIKVGHPKIAVAQGAPEFDILMKSYNEKHNASINTDSTNRDQRTLDNTDTLYVPHQEPTNEVILYWLAAGRQQHTVCGVYTVLVYWTRLLMTI